MGSEHQYVEVNCQRAIGGGNFAAGLQDFVFSIGRPSVFIPSKSYFRVELSLKATLEGVASKPKISSQLALAENCVASMYNNAYFLAGGQSVSQITNFLPQASAIEYRTAKQKGWVESIGASAFTYNPDLTSRISMVSGDTATAAFSQREGKDITYRSAAAAQYAAATVAVAADGIVTGVSTTFSAADIGSTLVISGIPFTITDVGAPLAALVTPVPVGAIPPTRDWYQARRASRPTDPSIEGKNVMHVLWCPTVLGIFNYGGVLGSGDYRIQLNPDANFKFAAVETLNTEYKDPANSYQFEVQNVVFYAAVAKLEVPDTISRLTLTEFACVTKNLTSPEGNFQFTVPSSTQVLYIAVQAGDAGSNPAHPPSRFIVGDSQELNLQSMQVTYANQTKPMTRWKSGFEELDATASSNLLTQIYYQTLIEGGRNALGAGTESEADWLTRGPIMAYRFARDVNDRSTEVQLQIGYGTPLAPLAWSGATRLFLIAEYINTVEITTQGGLVVEVKKVASV